MVQRLNVGKDQEPEDVRLELDNALDVASWRAHGSSRAYEPDPGDEGAPSWWRGDEDASGSFLKSVGVSLDG